MRTLGVDLKQSLNCGKVDLLSQAGPWMPRKIGELDRPTGAGRLVK
jgi:hypothetical protein